MTTATGRHAVTFSLRVALEDLQADCLLAAHAVDVTIEAGKVPGNLARVLEGLRRAVARVENEVRACA